MLGRFRNANVSSVAFVRKTVIRPPAPWVEPLAAPAPTLVYFDVNRKVSRVPEGSWGDGGASVYGDAPLGSQTGLEG